MDSSTTQTESRRSRVTLACKRCKRRKQRCDGDQPSCRSCSRAGVTCAYERPVRPQYPGGKSLYIKALEERIAFLEARVPDQSQDHFCNDTSTQSQSHCDVPQGLHNDAQHGTYSQSQGLPIEDPQDDRESLVNGVAYLSLCASGTADTSSEPYYVGTSSGATIARLIQTSMYKGAGEHRAPDEATAEKRRQSTRAMTPPTPSLSNESIMASLECPPLEDSSMLFDTFFERIHTRWPVLDREIYQKLFNRQYEHGGLSISVDPERHLIAATKSMDYILEQHSLPSLQFLVLLGVHSQRSPYGAGAWAQIRYATSLCIEMGLHRKRKRPVVSAEQARDTEMRRRVFWTCYCFDRSTSIVLGRPFAISDSDINVEFPSADIQFWTLTHKEPHGPTETQWSNVEPFIHIISLDRIQSRIHKAVFRLDRDVLNGGSEQLAKLSRKLALIKADLDEWRRSCPQTPKEANKTTWMYDPESEFLDARDFYGLQYHKSILLMFTIFLPTIEASDPRFIICARSAASVCTAYKRLNQNRTLTYTMISLHSSFVAGLTLVYCMWRDRSLFSYDTLEAVRDCSQNLTIFGEKWPGAVKYRDIFDALSGSVLRGIVSSGTSTENGDATERAQMEINISQTSNGRRVRNQHSASLRAADQPRSDREDTMSHMLSDAVKDAFMEVDEEAPGGWQGWRIWNEMVNDHAAPAPDQMCIPGQSDHGADPTSWNEYSDMHTFNVDPLQDSAMRLCGHTVSHMPQWNSRGFM
ncbi:hypothetical protein CKM354_000829700 [Cercospora kikuchii]|uniref:Zn(2)-C6 fungal-type domain-containing protein n=1 Tax=Cercospora kikuchii TaxID=84275 RepID=A0A9P3CIN7_9PEZI|nr:uncharacterized protein CKM354_000829700 [Cercospora kikuchii]GIZ45114.1 hypothetical protein CKM354_000829700 [Cercospora kikuchii]